MNMRNIEKHDNSRTNVPAIDRFSMNVIDEVMREVAKEINQLNQQADNVDNGYNDGYDQGIFSGFDESPGFGGIHQDG